MNNDNDTPRLIEHAFPLKQASLDSVHEKNVRHGHISTLHIWPARRPLAACRAALIATLLPDPGTPEKRKELCEKIGGKVVKKLEKKKMPNGQLVEREKEVTEGGILHWGLETENKELLDWFRDEIKKAYGGRAPKVLDPFAGGGAIPLEAMRLGCEATAVDINPVAWFILKCTLEYPQKLAGKTLPLPEFILENETFMHAFYKAHPHLVGRTKSTKKQINAPQQNLYVKHSEDNERIPKADLAWHVRAWGYWVLDKARRELAKYYPTYAEFETIDKLNPKPYEKQPVQLVPLKDDGTANIDDLNKDFREDYLAVKSNPRWIAKPTVAYLWARTVTCKNCRATVPLLKTRWLCKKEKKRVLLTIEVVTQTPDASSRHAGLDPASSSSPLDSRLQTAGMTEKENGVNPQGCHTREGGYPENEDTGFPLKDCGNDGNIKHVVFGIETDVPVKGSNTAQKREHDGRTGAGTMSRSGAKCPCCPAIMTMEDIRFEGQAGRLGSVMTAVVVDGQNGKEYRLPTEHEVQMGAEAEQSLQQVFGQVPFGLPDEPLPSKEALGFRVPLYGFDQWKKLFTPRQLITLGTFAKQVRRVREEGSLESPWQEAISAYMSLLLDKAADYTSGSCTWHNTGEKMRNTFARFALPITWDIAELAVINKVGGAWYAQLDWIARYLDHGLLAAGKLPPRLSNHSSVSGLTSDFDAIITDPPYYDSIPYSDCMDFFHIWLRRTLHGLSPEFDDAFANPLSPKWDSEKQDGELIDDSSRHGGDRAKSKQAYEDGMAKVFQSCHSALKHEGRLVIVFAHKHPNAWETLVSAIIRAGFVVDGSWPIQTEMGNRVRALSAAALSSSVWLVCKKRPITARPGWDTQVLEEMQQNIKERLREYWDAGIKGPDFVWAATGPGLEAYSKHPVVKKANDPGQIMQVHEFLNHVRRMVVDFVVGRVLSGDKDGDAELAAADRLDEPTAYYLLHRNDFGLDEAPAGACILYAISCGLRDKDLAATWDLISFTKGKSSDEYEEEAESDADEEANPEVEEESGSKVKLKTWAQRKGRSMGYDAPGGKVVPLIDSVHRLMHLWKAGDSHKVDEYLDDNGLRRHELFKRLLQSLIELSLPKSEERTLLEYLSNHIQARGSVPQMSLALPSEE